jgi:hypothetical protein
VSRTDIACRVSARCFWSAIRRNDARLLARAARLQRAYERRYDLEHPEVES